jgi:hypothetical protein
VDKLTAYLPAADIRREPVRADLQFLHQRPGPGLEKTSEGCCCFRLFPYDLDEDPLPAPAVKLSVEDLLPGPEIKSAVGHRDDDFASHDLTLVVRIAVVLTAPVVVIAFRARIVRGELLEPAGIVIKQALLIVVNEDAGGDVQGI